MRHAPLPEGPYYAVVFASQRTEGDQGYAAMADEMDALARVQPGYLGIESARDADGFGITVSYWRTGQDILAWKHLSDHLVAQRTGRERWYRKYSVRVCRVERSYDFVDDPPD